MPSYKSPGLYVEETTLQATVVTGSSLSAAAFIGPTFRGPTVPTLITNWNQYLQLFGGFGVGTNYLPYAVYQYFANGGREAYITRVVGSGATAATKDLSDRSPAASAVQSLTVTGTPTGGTFTVSYGGQTSATIAYNATAAVVQAALVAMSSIGAGNVLCAGGPLGAAFADGVSILASPIYTSATAAFTAADVGKAISGTNIPAGTTILSVQSATSATLSANATAAGTTLAFVVWRPVTITFQGTLANQSLATITTTSTGLTGGTAPAAVPTAVTAGTTGGLPTLRIQALSPGAWAGGATAVVGRDTLYIDITDSGVDRFNIFVRLGGTADSFVVERWTDLSMNDNDSRYAPNVVNSQVAGSSFIKIIDLVSLTAPVLDRPAVQAGTALAGGSDGAAVAEADIVSAISLLDVVDRPLGVNIPGDGVATTHTALLNYCLNRADCFAVLDPPSGQSPTAVVTFASNESPITSFGAIYYPWTYVADPAGGTGATRLLPPGGSVLGQFAATDSSRGVFKTPAGLGNRIAGAFAVETKLTNTDLGNLNTANVNAIRMIPGAGVVLMGGRTLKPNDSDKYISVRRSIIYIRSSLITSTRFALFEPNDIVLWTTLQTIISRFLIDFWQQGGLRGLSPDAAFYVKCDDENNTGATITAGEVHVEVGVALQYPAEFVVVQLVQREVGAAVTVSV